MNSPARARSEASISKHVRRRAVGGDQLDRAVGHLVRWVAHDRVAQRALARAVGAHQRVGLATVDREVTPLRIGLPSTQTCKFVIRNVFGIDWSLATSWSSSSSTNGFNRSWGDDRVSVLDRHAIAGGAFRGREGAASVAV